MMVFVLSMWMLGCAGEKASDDDTSDTSTAVERFSMAATEVPGGMMLAGWTTSTETLLVGGQLDGSSGTIWHLQGDELCYDEQVVEAPIWWIHGQNRDDWVAVGERGLVLHADGTRDDIPTGAKLFGVYQDAEQLWVVGGWASGASDDGQYAGGEVWRKQGDGAWEAVARNLSGDVFKVWDNRFVGAQQSYVWDGAELVADGPFEGLWMTTVRGNGDTTGVVGGTQVPIFWTNDGAGWEQPDREARCTYSGLFGLHYLDGLTFVAGANGQAASFDGTNWECADFPLTSDTFHAAWPHEGDMLFVGGRFATSDNLHGAIGRYNAQGVHTELSVTACD